ncbi:MAG: cardiolipin synthase [Pirellulaceae bacterium]|nr:cardiolipin synthase [Pirellulaceae bacterium]
MMTEWVRAISVFELWSVVGVVAVFLSQVVVAVRVIMSRRAVGETLAWIMLVLGLPVVGWVMYLLVGELRLGSARAKRIQRLSTVVATRLNQLDPHGHDIAWHQLRPECEQLARAGRSALQVPALPGNELELIDDWQKVFDGLVADIDVAKINCDFQFYIWHAAGRTSDIVAAIERACARGVTCRILVDSLGSWSFLHSQEVKRLRAAGAQVLEALPSRLWRLPFVRYDLRMHRKIVLIDDRLAWTGSLNMVDPRYFKREAGVGQWIDAMARVQGPAVEALAVTFQTDWQIESGSTSEQLPDLTGDQPLVRCGNSIVQVLPSGPAFSVEAIEQILITAIYMAREELVITSPYFVPSEALSMALASAARRGVRVIVIIPAQVDSLLVRHASRAFAGELLDAGVQMALFTGGLLHTKSVSIDRQTSLFGTLNMDPRSLRLNFEVTLAVYDPQFTVQLRQLQESYLRQSQWLDAQQWKQRPVISRFIENVAQLLSPLL